MTRIAFAADLHVDAYGSRIDPETGLNARLCDYLATTAWMAEEARRRGAEALVVAGDFTERRHPAPWLVSRIRGALSAFPGRQVYLRGNHDGEIAGGSIVTLLDDGFDEQDAAGRTGISRPRLEPIAFDVVLACIPHLDRHWLRAQPGMEKVPDAEVFQVLGDQFLTIARGLYAEARADFPDAACVLVCHQTLAGAHMSESQQAFLGDLGLVVDARALAAIGFEGVVAGHLHRHQVVLESPCPVLYPGSIERVDFGEEHEAKGFVIADVEPGQFAWEFVETPARRFVTVDYASDAAGFPDVEDAVVRAINVDPGVAADDIHKAMELAGAWDVVSITRLRPDAPEIAGGLSESLGPLEALSAYFADDPDAEPLVALGRELLEAAA
jgi:exonuclease SbcD